MIVFCLEQQITAPVHIGTWRPSKSRRVEIFMLFYIRNECSQLFVQCMFTNICITYLYVYVYINRKQRVHAKCGEIIC